jgi:ABC-2 type transport system ATP-binding protein
MTRLDRFRGRPMKNLSGGMKQKLGLACTLIHEPDLLVLDEPTTGVDPVSRRDFWAILADLLQERQMTALISTAYLDEASRFHRITLLDRGRVLTQGDPDAVIDQVPGSKVVVIAHPQMEAMQRLQSRFSVDPAGVKLEVFAEQLSVDAAEQAVREQLAGLRIERLQVAEAELEDVVLALLKREQPAEARGRTSLQIAAGGSSRPNGATDDSAIHAHALVKDFGDFRAVDQATFHVAAGEIFGLLGANGAGKTTVIKLLTGILRPTAGQALLAGTDTRLASQAVRQQIGYMSQAFSLYQDLTVLENIRLYAGIYGLDRRQTRDRLAWVLEVADLATHQAELAGRLPLGLRQRLALGCALVHDPRILFLDEPTSGVDPIGRRQIWDLIFALSRRQGVAILVTTHYMSEAERCDRLALMHQGRVVALASPDEMQAEVEREAGRVLVLQTDRPLAALKHLQASGHSGISLFGKRLHLLAPDADATADRIRRELRQAGIELLGIQQRPISMENVFVYRILQLDKQREEAA